jgi:hypothetical protein
MGALSLITHSFLPIYRATTAFAIPKGASSPKKSEPPGGWATQPWDSTLSFVHRLENQQRIGKYRVRCEWVQAGSLYYFTPSRVAAGQTFMHDLKSSLDRPKSNVA